MSGEELKTKIAPLGISVNELGRRLDMSSSLISQALQAKDIKTGLLERICMVLKVKMSFFYPDDAAPKIVNNNYGTQRARNMSMGDQTVNESAPADATKDNLISQLLQQNSQLIQQNAEFMAMIKGK